MTASSTRLQFLNWAIKGWLASGLLTMPLLAQSLESAKTLPKGVRNLTIRNVETEIDQKTDGNGVNVSLAQPLAQDLTFGKIAAGESKLKGNQMRAFLNANGFEEDDVVGSFSAELKGRVEVTAPIFAYGITDYVTFGVAVPFYKAVTAVEVGFTHTEKAQAFLNALSTPENNQTASAIEAGQKLNDAVGNLNTKLIDNGYNDLEDWRAEGPGDTTLVTKYRFFESSIVSMATSNGAVVPTGRTDDPDVLTDIAFGDGQWDIFTQMAVDQELGGGVRLNQYAKYVHQLPANKIVREVEEDEKIEVRKERTQFKLGDKYELGASAMFEPDFGFVAGAGYTYSRKFGDIYRELSTETKYILEDGTDQEARHALYTIGFSAVPLYKAGRVKVPFEIKMTYVDQLTSRNMPVSDLAQLDVNLFF